MTTLATRLVGTAFVLAFIALSVVRTTRPPRPQPATAPATAFSADRAWRHVEQIARAPHPMGTAEHDRVRDYILGELRALGLEPRVQAATALGTRYHEAGHVQNILVRLAGTGPTAGSKAVVLLAVHYDGVEAGPAAADDGAGCAAVLETLRALQARSAPMLHDVIVLFSDGEESGLLGAAAFVREDPWARDVAIALNFEARGTSGRSFMFETGPGNLDAVRMLRRVGDVSAGSVFTTIYRTLSNDTDLSELALLDVPALNFAFTDRVELYHTSHDDPAHLNRGSLQHHGAQMLALAQMLADGPLPRPRTGDAVFFDLPFLGLVLYPTWVALPIAIVLIALAAMVLRPREGRRSALIGGLMMLAATVASGAFGALIHLGAPAKWSGLLAAAVALLTVSLNLAVYLRTRARWGDAVQGGALLVWAVLSVLSSAAAPGVSYLFVWPALLTGAATLWHHAAGRWAAAAFTVTLLAGFAYAVSAIMLGVTGAGAIALVVLTSLITWLVAPVLQEVAHTPRDAALIGGLGVVIGIVGMVAARPSADHPIPTGLIHAESAASGEGFVGVSEITDEWTRHALPDPRPGPDWTAWVVGGRGLVGQATVPAPRQPPPTAVILSDSIAGQTRVLVVRLSAAPGTTGLSIKALGPDVLDASIDGRHMRTDRFRRQSQRWQTEFWNPAGGVVLALTVAKGADLTLDLVAWRPGLPPSVVIPPRPPHVVPMQSGDVSAVYARIGFPAKDRR